MDFDRYWKPYALSFLDKATGGLFGLYRSFLLQKAEELGVLPSEIQQRFDPRAFASGSHQQLVEEADAIYQIRHAKSSAQLEDVVAKLDRETLKSLRGRTMRIDGNGRCYVSDPALYIRSSPELREVLERISEV